MEMNWRNDPMTYAYFNRSRNFENSLLPQPVCKPVAGATYVYWLFICYQLRIYQMQGIRLFS